MPCECDGSALPRPDGFPGKPAAGQGETVSGQWRRPVVVKVAVDRVDGGVRSLLFLPNGCPSLGFGSHPSGRTVPRETAGSSALSRRLGLRGALSSMAFSTTPIMKHWPTARSPGPWLPIGAPKAERRQWFG